MPLTPPEARSAGIISPNNKRGGVEEDVEWGEREKILVV